LRQAIGEGLTGESAVVRTEREVKRRDGQAELDQGLGQQRVHEIRGLASLAMAMKQLSGRKGVDLQPLGRRNVL
jgi:hypothetical protein